MKLSEWMKLSREERTAHIDLSTPCLLNADGHRRKHVLLDFHELEDDCGNWTTARVQRCHLCECGRGKGWCANPQHFYFGTASENHLDIPYHIRIKGPSKSSTKGQAWGKTAEVRERFLSERPTGSIRQLADVYGVSHTTIRRWIHLLGESL